MSVVRRWYIYLVCAISLNGVAWAVIALLDSLSNNLFQDFSISKESVALQTAIILVGFPIFLVHWLWAQRLASRNEEERGSAVRRLYLYGMMASFLIPMISNIYAFLGALLGYLPRVKAVEIGAEDFGSQATHFVLVILVMSISWLYHNKNLREDIREIPEESVATTLRGFYIYGFSATGILMTALGSIRMIRWIITQFTPTSINKLYAGDITLIILGLALWIPFWITGQRLFAKNDAREQESTLRKFYLYAVIFVSVLYVVTQLTLILASLFRRVMKLPSLGVGIEGPLPIILVMAAVWIYHAYTLRQDWSFVKEAPRQAGIRRLYLYLVAAVGLAAVLVGLAGEMSLLIRAIGGVFRTELKEQFSWFTAALIASVPLWYISWKPVQGAALKLPPSGLEDRDSIVRKIYLYFFIFVATMTVLGSMVYIVFRLLSLLLGVSSGGNLLVDLGYSIAFSLIAVAVWLYHGWALRKDMSLKRQERTMQMANNEVLVVDTGDGYYGEAITMNLRHEFPGLAIDQIGLTPQASMENGGPPEKLSTRIANASLIVAPASVVIPCWEEADVPLEITQMIATSPARKLLLPVQAKSWAWIGVDNWRKEALVRQAVHAVKQSINGSEIKSVRPMSVGSIISIVIGVIFLLYILLAIASMLFSSYF